MSAGIDWSQATQRSIMTLSRMLVSTIWHSPNARNGLPKHRLLNWDARAKVKRIYRRKSAGLVTASPVGRVQRGCQQVAALHAAYWLLPSDGKRGLVLFQKTCNRARQSPRAEGFDEYFLHPKLPLKFRDIHLPALGRAKEDW